MVRASCSSPHLNNSHHHTLSFPALLFQETLTHRRKGRYTQKKSKPNPREMIGRRNLRKRDKTGDKFPSEEKEGRGSTPFNQFRIRYSSLKSIIPDSSFQVEADVCLYHHF